MKTGLIFLLSLIACITTCAANSRADQDVGYLYVESEPRHARIVIDGDDKLIVLAPLLCTLSVGPHELTVYSKDRQPSTLGIFITSGKILRKKIKFEGSRAVEQAFVGSSEMYTVNGNLSIVTNIFGGVIYLDSLRMNVTLPATLRAIPAGVHHVRIEHSGLGFDTSITIRPGVTETLQLTLLQLWELPPLLELPPPPYEGMPEQSLGETAPPPVEDALPVLPALVTVVINMELPSCRYKRALAIESGTPFDSFQIALPGEHDVTTPSDYPEVGGASDDNRRTLAFLNRGVPVWDEAQFSMRGLDATVSIVSEDKTVIVSHRLAVDSTMSLRPQVADLEVGMPVRLAKRYAQAPKGSEISFEVELFVNRSTQFISFESIIPIRKTFRINTDLNGGENVNVKIRVDTEGEVFFRYW